MSRKKEMASLPKLAALTIALHDLFKRETADVVEIGRLLKAAKKQVGHGNFLPWLQTEFSLSEKTAQNYMSAQTFMIEVAAPLLKSEKIADLKLRPSALYTLADMYQRSIFFDAEKDEAYSVTLQDIEAVLQAARKSPVGGKRLAEIVRERHAAELALQVTAVEEVKAGGIVPIDAPIAPAPTEAASEQGNTSPTEAAGEAMDAAGAGKGEQSTEKPPATAPRPKSAPSAKDEGTLTAFAANILNLKRLSAGTAKKYAATVVQTADLETVADFLHAVADLKKKQSAEARFLAEASAEACKAQYAEAA